MTKEEISPKDQKKKPLPKGLEQVSLEEYRAQHQKSIEIRNKKIKTSKTTSKIVQAVLILLAIPFVALILYFAFSMITAPQAAP